MYYVVTEPERVEARATRSLETLHTLELLLTFPQKSRVEELTNGQYGKHRFSVKNTRWDVQRNDSVAYPFKGEITVTYTRWASISHSTKAEAEADDNLFRANYGNISWHADATVAQQATMYMPLEETRTISLIYDKAAREWIRQEQETE